MSGGMAYNRGMKFECGGCIKLEKLLKESMRQTQEMQELCRSYSVDLKEAHQNYLELLQKTEHGRMLGFNKKQNVKTN
jgi:hypothetical protein